MCMLFHHFYLINSIRETTWPTAFQSLLLHLLFQLRKNVRLLLSLHLPTTSDQQPQQHCVGLKRIEMLVSGGRDEEQKE